ncbi:MAG: L-seryl-tRNA(Sec) selenium transferase [Candidatus Eisenbacteria sp.]|nr:L-seryl-tRNA(Sec) selenium transferase [Candidatus Eisenbacteria bacterium]
MGSKRKDKLRALPAVEVLLQHALLRETGGCCPRTVIVRSAREVLQEIREEILSAGEEARDNVLGSLDALAEMVLDRARKASIPGFRRVLNATGVVIHTNLGRSVLSERAAEAIHAAATGYSNLEYDLEQGGRTTRQQHVEPLLIELTGAQAALVVNNNAGAVMLVAHILARGREIVVSRGELVEIGGSFRLPEVLSSSGARRVEVGTTNRTVLGDYEAAIGPDTGMLLKVHRSNFVMSGYVTEVSLRDLVALGREHSIPVVEDLGSGALMDMSRLGLSHEMMPRESIAAGVDAVTFSGDKLLGGTQAGIIAGKIDVIGKTRGSPMARALRIDKLNLAGLEATLLAYRDPERVRDEIPTLRLIARGKGEIGQVARSIAGGLEGIGDGVAVTVETGQSEVGGGASPDVALPTVLVCLEPREMTSRELADRLRKADPSVIARIKDNRVLIDPRTLLPGEGDLVVRAVLEAAG